MLLSRVTRLVLVALALLILTNLSHTFFLNSISDEISDEIDDGLVEPLGQLVIGGGTKIVYDMLTYSYLDPIKPAIREVVKTVVVDGGGFILSNLISSIWSIIGLVLQFVTWLFDFSVRLSWRIKWDIKSFILDQLNPFSKRADTVNLFFGKSLLEELLHHFSTQ